MRESVVALQQISAAVSVVYERGCVLSPARVRAKWAMERFAVVVYLDIS